MTSLKPAAWRPADAAGASSRFASHLVRSVAAAVLRSASAAMSGAASRLAVQAPGVPEPRLATLEFYADAAAPEGALYADGYFVGWLEGVTRL